MLSIKTMLAMSAAMMITAAAQAADPVPAAAPVAAASASAAGAPAAVTAAAPATTDRMQQIVCRKDKVIGSLVSTKKTCHSRAQWAYIDDTNQAFSRDLVDNTRTRPGGN